MNWSSLFNTTFNEYFNLKKVSIKSTYMVGGYTLFSEKPEIVDGGMYTKDILKKRIIIALGGKEENQYFMEMILYQWEHQMI